MSHILNFHLPYIQYFKENGYEVHIAVQGNTRHPLIDRCYDLAFTKNLFSAGNIKTIFSLKKIIQENHYEVICSNTTLAGTAVKAALMMIRRDKPYFVHISHGYMFSQHNGLKDSFILLCEKMTKSPVDELVVMNNEDYILARKYQLGKNLHYIYGMGLDAKRFDSNNREQRQHWRRKIGADDHTKILLCVGELSARKNQISVIEVFNRLCREHQNIMLVLAGDGADSEKCRLLAEKYELGGRIRFLGQQQDVNLIYRSCDLLVSASKMEGLPFNVMEALYCGLPAALSAVKGHVDLAEDGVNAVLFDANDRDDMFLKINEVLSDEALYGRLKSNASLDEKYLLDNVRPTLLAILDRDYRKDDIQKKERVHL